MNEVSWEKVEGIVLLLGAIVLVITGNDGWAFFAVLAWGFR